jgi:flagellar basal body-associated protein FliL
MNALGGLPMDLGTLLSTILLVSFIVTIILAIGSYMAYKFRERRRPRESARTDGAPVYFERVDLGALVAPGSGKRDEG